MLILNRPAARITVRANEADVSFPADAEVIARLGPAEYFGEAPLSGKLSIAPVGCELRSRAGSYRGADRSYASGSFERVEFASTFIGIPFHMRGDEACFRLRVGALAELDLFVTYVDALFPAIFSGLHEAPLEVLEISGRLADKKFVFAANWPVSNAISCLSDHASDLKRHWDQVSPSGFWPVIAVVSAARYLQQADRLAAEGRHSTTFLGERILNLSKCLEALFTDSVDCMRKTLAELDVAEAYRNLFSTVRYLRNEVDAGHAAFRDLPDGVLSQVYQFVELATECIRKLINRLMNDPEAQGKIDKLRSPPSGELPSCIKRIDDYLGLLPPVGNDLSAVQLAEKSA